VTGGPVPRVVHKDRETVISGRVAGAVVADASPLKTYDQAFQSRSIGQSSPYPGTANTIYVTIASNVDLAAGDEVTVSGLTGASTCDNA